MDFELLLNDLIAIDRKMERLAEERKKGGGRDKAVIEREIVLFERFKAALEENHPLREVTLSSEEEKTLAGFGFSDPQAHAGGAQPGRRAGLPSGGIRRATRGRVALQGKLEMEIAQLPPEDAEMFMAEYGIEEPGLNRVIRLSYDLLGLQSFFTVGEDEVRAWTVRRGASAHEACRGIHTDLQKGFIRAEVVTYEDLVTLGGLAEARAKGKLRLEGKEYIVQRRRNHARTFQPLTLHPTLSSPFPSHDLRFTLPLKRTLI